MNVTERTAILDGLSAYQDVESLVGDRTLEILDRRRRGGSVRRRGWLVRRLLLVSDLVGLTASILIAEWVVNRRSDTGALGPRAEVAIFLATLPAWVVIAKLYGLYDHDEERTDHSGADDIPGVFHMVTVCTWMFAVASYLTHLTHPTLAKLVLFWAIAVPLIGVSRAAARGLARRNVAWLQNTIIVGAGDVGQLVAKKLLNHPEYGLNLVGFVDSQPKERRDGLEHLALLGGTERVASLVRAFDVDRVIIAFSNDAHEQTLDLVRSLRDLVVQVDIVPRLFELVGPGVGVHTVEGLPLVGLAPPRLPRSSQLLKALMDVFLATFGTVALSPLFIAIAVAIKLDSPGPVLFRQVRMGSKDRTFTILKFRTMTADAESRKSSVAHLNQHLASGGDSRMFKIADDPRVTRVGHLLRRFSLDELPQLINVLRLEMSLVGPRPLILDEDRHVSTWGRRRLNLKPGITGPWQVLGRSGIPFDEMVTLDYLYVTGWSIGGDLKLIAKTVPLMFSSNGNV